MRSLADLTRTFNLTTLIINGVIMPRIRQAPTEAQNPMAKETEPSPSIFMANSAWPALGRSFVHYLDLHLLLSVLPKSERDARIMYGNAGGDKRSGLPMGSAETVNVIEVLADRYDGRTAQWAAFMIDDGIELKAVFW
jgi:hypothetical protein